MKPKMIIREAKDRMQAVLVGDALEDAGIEVFSIRADHCRPWTYEVWGKVKNFKDIARADKCISKLLNQ